MEKNKNALADMISTSVWDTNATNSQWEMKKSFSDEKTILYR